MTWASIIDLPMSEYSAIMPRTVFASQFANLDASIKALIDTTQTDMAAHTIERALEVSSNETELTVVANTLKYINQTLQNTQRWAALSARLYCMTKNFTALKTLLYGQPRNLLAYHAWYALIEDQNATLALSLAREATSEARGYELGLAYRTQAKALLQNHLDGWQEAFTQACQHFTGVSLGRCQMDFGQALEQNGQHTNARNVWAKALLTVANDPYYAALTYYNIGISCLKLGSNEAEQVFYDMKRAVGRIEARQFKARAEYGIASARRAFGEYHRALHTYQNALKQPGDEDDKRQIMRGIGHTKRLLGLYTQALTDLEKAANMTAQDLATKTSWVYADIAALHAQQGDLHNAKIALERHGDLSAREEDSQRVKIVKAEMARLERQPKKALQYLNEVNPNRLWVWEEARCFPQLFELWDKARGATTRTISATTTKVTIRLYGTIQVKVNNRIVPIKTNGRPAELLGLLLYHHNNLSIEQAIEALFPQDTDEQTQRSKKMIWQLCKTLRQILGWDDSIKFGSNSIELDENATWKTDLQAKGKNRFLDGISSDWVIEIDYQRNAQT
jgi:tetratricopeptide (TPR) repeat protein